GRLHEKPRLSSGVELLYSRRRTNLQRQDPTRYLLVDRYAGNLDWNRRGVWLGLSSDLRRNGLLVCEAASLPGLSLTKRERAGRGTFRKPGSVVITPHPF